jgi:hypothetical protein
MLPCPPVQSALKLRKRPANYDMKLTRKGMSEADRSQSYGGSTE